MIIFFERQKIIIIILIIIIINANNSLYNEYKQAAQEQNSLRFNIQRFLNPN
jgi:hypothetical protein